jgi:hypothetical protein
MQQSRIESGPSSPAHGELCLFRLEWHSIVGLPVRDGKEIPNIKILHKNREIGVSFSAVGSGA